MPLGSHPHATSEKTQQLFRSGPAQLVRSGPSLREHYPRGRLSLRLGWRASRVATRALSRPFRSYRKACSHRTVTSIRGDDVVVVLEAPAHPPIQDFAPDTSSHVPDSLRRLPFLFRSSLPLPLRRKLSRRR